jgi:hypothetical protein
MARGGVRYGLFVHDPDGDSGYGRIVGAFKTVAAAEAKAEAIERAAGLAYVECIVLEIVPGDYSAHRLVKDVIG